MKWILVWTHSIIRASFQWLVCEGNPPVVTLLFDREFTNSIEVIFHFQSGYSTLIATEFAVVICARNMSYHDGQGLNYNKSYFYQILIVKDESSALMIFKLMVFSLNFYFLQQKAIFIFHSYLSSFPGNCFWGNIMIAAIPVAST